MANVLYEKYVVSDQLICFLNLIGFVAREEVKPVIILENSFVSGS